MSHNRLTRMMVIVSLKLRHHLPENISVSVFNSQVQTSDHVRNFNRGDIGGGEGGNEHYFCYAVADPGGGGGFP